MPGFRACGNLASRGLCLLLSPTGLWLQPHFLLWVSALFLIYEDAYPPLKAACTFSVFFFFFHYSVFGAELGPLIMNLKDYFAWKSLPLSYSTGYA